MLLSDEPAAEPPAEEEPEAPPTPSWRPFLVSLATPEEYSLEPLLAKASELDRFEVVEVEAAAEVAAAGSAMAAAEMGWVARVVARAAAAMVAVAMAAAATAAAAWARAAAAAAARARAAKSSPASTTLAGDSRTRVRRRPRSRTGQAPCHSAGRLRGRYPAATAVAVALNHAGIVPPAA